MARVDRLLLSQRPELPAGVFANGLQHPITVSALDRHDQRLGDEAIQSVEDLVRCKGFAGRHRFGCRECPSAGKYGQACEQHLLDRLQQIVAPIDQRAKRLVARQSGAAAAGQQGEAVVEPGRDHFHRQRTDPGSRQFERKGDPIQTSTDGCDRRRLSFADRESRLLQASAFDEQADRVGAHQRGEIGFRIRQRQDRQRVNLLALHPQRLAARCQHADSRSGVDQRTDQIGAGRQQVLTVVEQHQYLPRSDVPADRLGERRASLFAQAQDPRERIGNQRSVGDCDQIDEPHAIRVGIEDVGSDLEGKPRLADPPGPSNVRTRVCASSRLTSVISPTRPMKEVTCCGRLFGVDSSERNGGKS